jgi:hypothetical protein
MNIVLWVAGHGPDRAHDTLNSATFEQKKFADAFVEGQSYWRISRMEYHNKCSPGIRTDEIGGVDVDREVERVRQQMQYETGLRATEAQALARWRGLVARRQSNPAKKRRTSRRRRNAVLTKPDFAIRDAGKTVLVMPLTKYARQFVRQKLEFDPSPGLGGQFKIEKLIAPALLEVLGSVGFVFKRG